MHLGGTVTFNGLSLNTVTRTAGGVPSSGYLIERFAPAPPPPTAYLEKRALTDGLDASDVFLGGRTFNLIVTAFGSTAGDFWDKAQDLFEAFSPTITYDSDSANAGFIAFDFSQPTANVATWPASAYPNGIPMRYYLRPLEGPTYAIERDKDGGSLTSGRVKPFSIPLIARDPRKYLQSATVTGQFTTTFVAATYRGDYWSHPIITFSLSATGHSAFNPVFGDGSFAHSSVINLSSRSSGTFTLDFGKRTFVDNTGASMAGLIGSSVAYGGQVRSGTTFRYLNPTGISSCTMTYREAWA